jgi:hypothetical protein
MKLKRLAALATLSAMVTAGTVFGAVSSASAAPTNCTITYGGNWAQSLCTGGTGEHRIHMVQQHFLPGVGPIACYGNWAPVGSVSSLQCSYHTITSVWISTRG